MDTRRLQILRASWWQIPPSDLRTLAGRLLDEGEESPALIELFSLSPDAARSAGPELFERAMREIEAQDLDEDPDTEAIAQWTYEAGLQDVSAHPETVKAMEDFVRAVPELEPAWSEHLEENGEPLPHVFFGDVSRFAVQVSESGDAPLRERLSTAIERLAASESLDVVNVIHVSFAENLVWGDERHVRALADLRGTFGPVTLQRIAEFEEWAAKYDEWASKATRRDGEPRSLMAVLRAERAIGKIPVRSAYPGGSPPGHG